MKDQRELEDFLRDFKPMIEGVKRRLIRKWFALEAEEIESLVNLSIYKLWRKNKKEKFILTKGALTQVAERAVIKQICKAPNVEVKISYDKKGKRKKTIEVHPLSYLDDVVGDDITLMDLIPDDSPTPQEVMEEEEEFKERKALVLAIISERTYKQLVFEYEHKCVSQENLNLIQKIKKAVAKHEQH